MRPVILFLCVLCASVANLHAQAADPLKAFDSFIGGTWVAEGEFPGIGRYTAARTYRKILDGKFIEMEQVMHVGSAQASTVGIIGWDAGKHKIAAWGFSDDGSLALTECSLTSPDEFVFEGRLVGGVAPGLARGTFRRTGPDQFAEMVHVKKDGEWQPRFQFAFSSRAKPSPSDSTTNATPAPELRPLERMVGLWIEEVRLTNARYTAEFEARWALGGKFLVSELRMLGTANAGLRSLSFTSYHAEQKRLVQYSFNSDGGILVARVTASSEVPEMVFEGDLVGPRPRTLRLTYRRRDEDTLTSNTEVQYLGIFQPADNSTWRRKTGGGN